MKEKFLTLNEVVAGQLKTAKKVRLTINNYRYMIKEKISRLTYQALWQDPRPPLSGCGGGPAGASGYPPSLSLSCRLG